MPTTTKPLTTAEWVDKHLATAPPLTAEQSARIADLLRLTPDRQDAA